MEKLNVKEIVFSNFKEEAELFFVNEFMTNENKETGVDKVKEAYNFCLDVVFNITKSIDFSKGLVISSTKYGQGKSFFFDVVHHRVKRTKNQNIYKRTNSEELCNIFINTKKGQDPMKELLKFINGRNLYIDDIGDELKDGQFRVNYGNKINVLRFVILERYRLWSEKGFKLFGTTNLTDEQIASNYGGRVADRMNQMCYNKEFTFLNGSFRQVSSIRKLTQEEIRQNWLKLKKKEQEERIDLEAYFNIMIEEDVDKLKSQGQHFWNFCCVFLKNKGLLTDKDFETIDDNKKEWARKYIYMNIREVLRTQLKHAPVGVFNTRIKEAKQKVDDSQVIQKCESLIAKDMFLKLKEEGHRF